MAIDHYTVSVSSTPAVLVTAPIGVGETKCKIYVANTGANDVFIGDATVSNADGYLLVKQNGQTVGYRQEFELFGGETLYVCSAPTFTSSVAVIVTGK